MHPETAKSLWDEATKRVEWLEEGLKDIIKWISGRNPISISEIEYAAQAILDGEPTTADEYNYEHDQLNEIDDMNEAIKKTPEYKAGKNIMKIYQFGGDTGIDADYYDENSEKFLKVSK